MKNNKKILTHIFASTWLRVVYSFCFALLCLFLFFVFFLFKGLSRVQPNWQLFSIQLCCKSVKNRRARIAVSLIYNWESASRKVAGSLAFSQRAAFFARDLHWPKAWRGLCEHQNDWLVRGQWALHVAETWIFLPLHSPLNGCYWSLELANERSVCKMFAFTTVSGKKVILTYSKDRTRLQFFFYNACLLPKQSTVTFFLFAFHLHFAPRNVNLLRLCSNYAG